MKITKFNPCDKVSSLEEEVEIIMASEFGYLMSETDKFLDIDDNEDAENWRNWYHTEIRKGSC